ncbi:MAG: hypothetical protein ABIR68_04315 [Ilumatobacteraceae bacterium]
MSGDHPLAPDHAANAATAITATTATTATTAATTAAGQEDVERWLIRRGVPHLIDDYAAGTDIWARAVPILVVAYLAGGFQALDLSGWTANRNVLAAAVILVVLAATWLITNAVRRRPLLEPPRQLGAPELAAFLVGPAIPSLLFGQWKDAAYATAEGVAVLAVIYVVTCYGLVPLAVWAARRTVDQLGALGRIVARGLPLLLLFNMFLFINADVWQMGSTLQGAAYVASLAVFLVLGTVFVLSRIPDLTAGLNDFADWATVDDLVAGTPAESFQLPAAGAPPAAPLSGRQRVNVALVSIVSQALQITLVTVLLTMFFVLFGLFAISAQTTQTWTGLTDIREVVSFHFGSQRVVITESLLRVAGFLGAFSGMYFTVVLATDVTYRDAFSDDIGPQVRQALAVRIANRWQAAHRPAS